MVFTRKGWIFMGYVSFREGNMSPKKGPLQKDHLDHFHLPRFSGGYSDSFAGLFPFQMAHIHGGEPNRLPKKTGMILQVDAYQGCTSSFCASSAASMAKASWRTAGTVAKIWIRSCCFLGNTTWKNFNLKPCFFIF